MLIVQRKVGFLFYRGMTVPAERFQRFANKRLRFGCRKLTMPFKVGNQFTTARREDIALRQNLSGFITQFDVIDKLKTQE
ncbi:hypothetical protein D3C81_1995750 [compost metagenome]